MIQTKVNTAGLSYDDIKKVALNAEPKTKKVSLSEIEIDNNGQLSISGVHVRSEENVKNQLLKILRIQPSFLKRFGKLTDEETTHKLVSIIKSGLALSDVKNQKITILGNPTTQTITHLIGGDRDFISNKMAIDLFERIMNGYPQLKLQNFEVHPDSSIIMNMISKVQIAPTTKDGKRMVGEEFNPGLTFKNNPFYGADVDAFTHRLVCENGMTVINSIGSAHMKELNDRSLDGFMKQIAALGANDFVPAFYGEQMERAQHNRASFGELEMARKIILHNSAMKSDSKDLNSYLPEFSAEAHKLAARGFDYVKCTDRQLQNSPVNATVWDVVNRLTDFGSHDYGFSANFDAIQRAAGKLFNKKEYDTEGLLLSMN